MLFAGYGLKRLVPILARYNIPAPVAGGLPVAALLTFFYTRGWQPIEFDTTLQTPLMIAFFTSVGFGASVNLLRRGGPLVLAFTVIASIVAALQNLVGAVDGDGAGPASAHGRACRVGHLDRRSGNRPRVRAAVRAGRRDRGADAGGGRGDGRNRGRWPHWRPDRHVSRRTSRTARRGGAGRRGNTHQPGRGAISGSRGGDAARGRCRGICAHQAHRPHAHGDVARVMGQRLRWRRAG